MNQVVAEPELLSTFADAQVGQQGQFRVGLILRRQFAKADLVQLHRFDERFRDLEIPLIGKMDALVATGQLVEHSEIEDSGSGELVHSRLGARLGRCALVDVRHLHYVLLHENVYLIVLERRLVYAEIISEHLMELCLRARVVSLEVEEHHGVLQGLECSRAYEMLIGALEVVVLECNDRRGDAVEDAEGDLVEA